MAWLLAIIIMASSCLSCPRTQLTWQVQVVIGGSFPLGNLTPAMRPWVCVLNCQDQAHLGGSLSANPRVGLASSPVIRLNASKSIALANTQQFASQGDRRPAGLRAKSMGSASWPPTQTTRSMTMSVLTKERKHQNKDPDSRALMLEEKD